MGNKEIIDRLSDVEYITHEGYYVVTDDGDELHKHTEDTYRLYEKGLSKREVTEDSDDMYNGVCFSGNDILAEWEVEGKTKYYKL